MAIAGIDQNGDFNTSATSSTKYSTSKSEKNNNSTLDKDAFLQLLVTQMKYQDPLNPQDNTQMVSQMATFSQVEQMQNMSHTMSQNQASSLLGKVVIMKAIGASGDEGYIQGKVDYVLKEGEKVYLGINGNEYDLDDLDTVVDDDFYNSTLDTDKA